MTLLAAAILVQDSAQAQADMASAAEHGANLIELRLDDFLEVDAAWKLVRSAPLPVIVTVRSTAEGGHFDGTDTERLEFLSKLISAQPAYVDLELVRYSSPLHFRGPDGDGPRLILSAHDFKGRPDRLNNLVSQMSRIEDCTVAKVAWRARSVRDNVEAMELLATKTKPTIALCMGEAGLPSRILAKKFGGFLTFASVFEGSGTASGQPTIAELRDLYRWNAMGKATRVFGVVGNPVNHSMSPAIHNAAFSEVNFDGVYMPLPVDSSYEAFKAFMESFLAFKPLHFSGCSVTIPHKENALRYVQEKGGQIEQLAERIGAANTVVVGPNGNLAAYNTDYAAALDALTATMDIEREELANYRVAVLGAGGAARAVVAGLAHYGSTVVVYNRTKEKADSLAAEFSSHRAKVVPARLEKICDACCQVFINCTSLGMHPNVDQTPVPDHPDWNGATVVFDTVYTPLQTRLLRDANAAGCRTVQGVEMFVNQAAAQFRFFTGLDAPVKTMRQVVLERLAKS